MRKNIAPKARPIDIHKKRNRYKTTVLIFCPLKSTKTLEKNKIAQTKLKMFITLSK
jgi:hypothetical protein